ncbi:hypothetical protein C2E23DRAFT_543836 [Lenzites betulinus]|nr:hypothetical protein C2E23DRAFT_543836 [Lenzites betulinus]
MSEGICQSFRLRNTGKPSATSVVPMTRAAPPGGFRTECSACMPGICLSGRLAPIGGSRRPLVVSNVDYLRAVTAPSVPHAERSGHILLSDHRS